MAATRDQLASILDALTEQAVVGVDTDGTVTYFNSGAERLTGHSTRTVIGEHVGVFFEPRELEARAAELGVPVGVGVLVGVATRQRHETRQWTVRRADGTTRQASLTITAVRDGDGAVTGFTGIATDVTDRVLAQAQLADSEELFRLTFDLAPVGMAMVCLSPGTVGLIRRTNRSFAQFVGRDEAELLQLHATDLFHPDDGDAHAGVMAAFMDGSLQEWRSERRFLTPAGELRWGALSTGVVHPSSGGDPYLVALVEDVTEQHAAAEAMAHLALHDALTGLPNRRLLADRLEHSLATCARTGSSVGVLYLDLDGFKAVNDALGHAAGDDLLVAVAERLRRCVRVGDTVARLGGDEFAVVCPDVAADDDLGVVALRIVAALAEPVDLAAGTARIGTSIGATTSTGVQEGDQLLGEADTAMYEAKRAGKGRVVFHRRSPLEPEGARLLG